MYIISNEKLRHSPRSIKFWECCLAKFYENLSSYNANRAPLQGININQLEVTESGSSLYLDEAFDNYMEANQHHYPAYKIEDRERLKNEIYKQNIPAKIESAKRRLIKQEIKIVSKETISKPKIAVANTRVFEKNIKDSIQGKPNLSGNRFDALYNIFKQTKEVKANILLFPECFVPIEFLDRITWYAVAEQKLIVTGIEHRTIKKTSFNFIVTILPFEKDGVKDAVVIYRLKNHYSHSEKLMIEANHFKVPKPKDYIYDLFIWKGIYFSPYYCFELADVKHRSIFRSKIDLLIASEWNPDVNYFSNIVESISRDLHVYVAQVNTSHYGDNRITQPTKTETKDILRLKGGENDTILVGEIDIASLRDFQRESFITTRNDKNFKPLPPNFHVSDTLKRINNESVL